MPYMVTVRERALVTVLSIPRRPPDYVLRADDNGKTLKYADSDYVDVYLNGICLVPVTDYTSTSKTSIVLTQAASLNDTLEVVAYDIATISDTVSKADGGLLKLT